ncbi:hypothetical protein DAEQUDRAFT_722275 [Daedalea quercina L-15889]|uniref:F-box domain-containing protein n=1 Tax=Daedalea quercina L-15889 TaxID=1314783 RepID=A0A165TAH8_9APHY|nr:hypothetical protein DAEQUDRAFT_722275 [Daedalea quercina L-15889]
MASEPRSLSEYPSELYSIICAHVYDAGCSPPTPSLDPVLHAEGDAPTALPSSYPPACWLESVSKRTLKNLCLVNHAWCEAAKPWLWRKVEVSLPRNWLALVDEIAGGEGEDPEQAALFLGQTIHAAETAALVQESADKLAPLELHAKVIRRLSTSPDGSIPPELLSPLASREPSPRRLRQKSKSPARWKLIRSISDVVRNIMEHEHPGMYVPSLEISHVGRYVRHLDFNHFRTIGMRRSVEEGVNNRFVTGERLESVLKEMPSLLAFGATEYMDGALTFPVLKELLLRSSASRGRGRPSRGRDLVIFDPNDAELQELERRRDCKELEAIDLTGCISAVFVNALTQFVNEHLVGGLDGQDSESDEESPRERARPKSRNAVEEPLTFPGLQRLGLRGVKSIQPHILHQFVLAFPSLTHLDLSCTRITPDLLAVLGTSSTIRLRSLSLERCNWLTGESIRHFLVHASCVEDARELSLYGDPTWPSVLSAEDLDDIFSNAPCFTSGKLVYLDLSSVPLRRAHLHDVFAPQPSLRSLGLSYMRELELGAVADFLKMKAPNVEVLTLVASTPELGYGSHPVSVRQVPITLHAQVIRPLCTPPFSFSLNPSKRRAAEPPTRLRVIELAASLLASLGSGAGSWRVVKSKGGRAWYVDVASGWVAEPGVESRDSVLRRDLPPGHPWRLALERLSDANGNVSSGIGWHSRKLEVLHGHGLLGREAGLYGAVSFAYQG